MNENQPITGIQTPANFSLERPWIWAGVGVISVLGLLTSWYYFYAYTPEGYEPDNYTAGIVQMRRARNDGLSEIEKEIYSIDAQNLDSELNDIDKELQ